MIIVRVAKGVTQHFNARFSEWVMVLPLIGMFAALQMQPDMFSKSPSFSVLAQYGDEMQWAFICGICAAVRFLALTVNGTFADRFPYTPHGRCFASLVGVIFWSQFTNGFIVAAVDAGGSYSPLIAYGTFCVFEFGNVLRSFKDAVALHHMRRGNENYGISRRKF